MERKQGARGSLAYLRSVTSAGALKLRGPASQ